MLIIFIFIVVVLSLIMYVFGWGLFFLKFDIFKCFEGKLECLVELYVLLLLIKYNDNFVYVYF